MINLIFLAAAISLIVLILILVPLRQITKRRRVLLGLGLCVVFAMSYGAFGGWHAYIGYQQALARRAQAEAMLQSMGDVKTVIKRLREQVMQHPKQVKGWYLLGRLYASQNQWLKAEKAFETAHRLRPHDERITLNWAQSLLASGNSDAIQQARNLLQHILKQHPSQVDALAMLATEAYARQAYQEAIEYWQRVLVILPADSQEAKQVSRTIEHIKEALSAK